MKLYKFIITSILIIQSACYADCPQPVQPIKSGDKANCSGFIFSDAAEKQAEQYRSDSLFYKSYSDGVIQKDKLISDQNDVLQKRLNLYVQESSTLSTAIAKKDSNESLYRFGYFILGVVATGLIVRNLRQ